MRAICKLNYRYTGPWKYSQGLYLKNFSCGSLTLMTVLNDLLLRWLISDRCLRCVWLCKRNSIIILRVGRGWGEKEKFMRGWWRRRRLALHFINKFSGCELTLVRKFCLVMQKLLIPVYTSRSFLSAVPGRHCDIGLLSACYWFKIIILQKIVTAHD